MPPIVPPGDPGNWAHIRWLRDTLPSGTRYRYFTTNETYQSRPSGEWRSGFGPDDVLAYLFTAPASGIWELALRETGTGPKSQPMFRQWALSTSLSVPDWTGLRHGNSMAPKLTIACGSSSAPGAVYLVAGHVYAVYFANRNTDGTPSAGPDGSDVFLTVAGG
jgi:hypothetical protein